MNRVRMLIHFGVTPYMVFDGDYLPSKAATELERSKKRGDSRKIGLELHRMGKSSQAHIELQKAIDVTPEMARQLIEELKRHNVQYVVAPYEADAQLVYLERRGAIQGILSEDSDLLVFGAKCLLTKLDQYGDCVVINRSDFATCRDVSLVGWSDAEFRRMAILSGCDYLPSISKMGLKTAYRLVRKHKTIEKIIRMLHFDGQFLVPPDYLKNFHQAELTFLHQRVFCPDKKELVMATDTDFGETAKDLSFIGDDVQPSIAFRVAIGDLHPMTKQPLVVKARANGTQNHWQSVPAKLYETMPSDLKPHNSIKSYYKPKRIPLAELDVNTFTPSPSLLRLLDQESVWSPSPVPNLPKLHRSPIPLTPLKDTPATQLGTLGTGVRAADRIGWQPAKRPRLCEEAGSETNVNGGPSTVEVENCRSHFFSSSKLELSPSIERKRKSTKPQANAISIWHDDSFKNTLVDFPNIDGKTTPIDESRESKTAKTQKPFIDSTVDTQSENSVSSNRLQSSTTAVITSNPSRFASLSTSVSSGMSTDGSNVNNQSFGKNTVACHISLQNRFGHQHFNGSNSIVTSRHDVQCPLDSSQGINPQTEPQSKRLKGSASLHVIQSNIEKTHAYGALCHQSLIPVANKSTELLPHPRRSTSLAENAQVFEPPAQVRRLSVQGSEDLIIPNTDEEADETNPRLGSADFDQSKLDLSQFAFAGQEEGLYHV